MQGVSTRWRRPLGWTAGILMLLVVAYVAWLKVYVTPQRAFSDMLVNNLSTAAVTKNELSGSKGNASLERVSLQLGGTAASRWLVTVQKSSGTVSTESIGQKGIGYVRYTQIINNAQKQDYSKALNVWAKSSPGDGSALPDLFSQSLLDMSSAPVPPLGDPSTADRQKLLDYIRQEAVFTPRYDKVSPGVVNGRKVYVIPVAVKLAPYVRMMQAFSHSYGLTALDSISATDYQSTAPVTLTISVDKLSHQMLRVGFASTGFNESYSDYGIARPLAVPIKTISVPQLQALLKAAQ